MFFLNNIAIFLKPDLILRVASPLVPLQLDLFEEKGIEVWIKREDLIHPLWGGNKYRKLKYNLIAYQNGDFKGLVTFGGLHSNHIFATAAICEELGISCHGVIRGQEPSSSPTLDFAAAHGMQIHRISRTEYKMPAEALKSLGLSENYYFLSEGGTNSLALKGCQEVSTEIFDQLGSWPTNIICPFGTGGTAAGLLKGMDAESELLIFPVLKGNWVEKAFKELLEEEKINFQIFSNAHLGGYGKFNQDLLDFMIEFTRQTQILLDPIYTGKMFYAFFELVKNDYFSKGTSIVGIHTGGLQGIKGFNKRFKLNLPEPD